MSHRMRFSSRNKMKVFTMARLVAMAIQFSKMASCVKLHPVSQNDFSSVMAESTEKLGSVTKADKRPLWSPSSYYFFTSGASERNSSTNNDTTDRSGDKSMLDVSMRSLNEGERLRSEEVLSLSKLSDLASLSASNNTTPNPHSVNRSNDRSSQVSSFNRIGITLHKHAIGFARGVNEAGIHEHRASNMMQIRRFHVTNASSGPTKFRTMDYKDLPLSMLLVDTVQQAHLQMTRAVSGLDPEKQTRFAMLAVSLAISILILVAIHANRKVLVKRMRLFSGLDKFDEFKMYVFIYEARCEENMLMDSTDVLANKVTQKNIKEMSVRIIVGSEVKTTISSTTGKFRKAMSFVVPQGVETVIAELLDRNAEVIARRTFDIHKEVLTTLALDDRFYKFSPASYSVSKAYVRVKMGAGCPDLDEEFEHDKAWGQAVPKVEEMEKVMKENASLRSSLLLKTKEIEEAKKQPQIAAEQVRETVKRMSLQLQQTRQKQSILQEIGENPMPFGKVPSQSTPVGGMDFSSLRDVSQSADGDFRDNEASQQAWLKRISTDMDQVDQKSVALLAELQLHEAESKAESLQLAHSHEALDDSLEHCYEMQEAVQDLEVCLEEETLHMTKEADEVKRLQLLEEHIVGDNRKMEETLESAHEHHRKHVSITQSSADSEADELEKTRRELTKLHEDHIETVDSLKAMKAQERWKLTQIEAQRDADIGHISDELTEEKANLRAELYTVRTEEEHANGRLHRLEEDHTDAESKLYQLEDHYSHLMFECMAQGVEYTPPVGLGGTGSGFTSEISDIDKEAVKINFHKAVSEAPSSFRKFTSDGSPRARSAAKFGAHASVAPGKTASAEKKDESA